MRVPMLVVLAALAAWACTRDDTRGDRERAAWSAPAGETGYQEPQTTPGGPATPAPPAPAAPAAPGELPDTSGTPGTGPQTSRVQLGITDRYATDADRDLILRYRALIATDAPGDPARYLQIEATGGALTLRGTVGSEDERTRLIRQAEEIGGAGNVVDQLRVVPPVRQGFGTPSAASGKHEAVAKAKPVPPAEPEAEDEPTKADEDEAAQAEATSLSAEKMAEESEDLPEPADVEPETPAEPFPGGPVEPEVPMTTGPAPFRSYVPTPTPRYAPRPARLRGFAVMGGGGIGGFMDTDVQDMTDVAGQYDVRLAYGTRSRFALEAAYIGSAQSIDALGLDGDALLFGNGAELVGRVQPFRGALQPYAAVGFGWRHYELRADVNSSNVENDDEVFELPLALGVGYRLGRFLLDGRATVRPAFDEDLIGDEGLQTWGVTGHVGVEF